MMPIPFFFLSLTTFDEDTVMFWVILFNEKVSALTQKILLPNRYNNRCFRPTCFSGPTCFPLQVMDAQRIVIVGGGAVGVELAGEIKTDFSAKEVGRILCVEK